ncbi:MAG: MBL fold metallo-hydrolase [Candidatus Micrarchaeota archaeon]|nr:MBL fold metallo-hydrolase [Candidatus Micrarchaeota archaeon]
MNKILVFLLEFFLFLFLIGCVSDSTETNDSKLAADIAAEAEQPTVQIQNNQSSENKTAKEVFDINPSKQVFVNESEPKKDKENISILIPKLPHDIAEIYFFDVGFGDATLIRTRAVTILIGTGPKESSALLVEKLRALGVKKIDELILDSWLDTKVGGFPLIAKRFAINRVWAPSSVVRSSSAAEVYSLIKKNNFVLYNPKVNDSIAFEDLKIEVFNPQEKEYEDYPEANSIVLRVSYGNFCLFLPSDIEQELEPTIISLLDDKNCTVYKWRKNGEGRPTPSVLFNKLNPSAVVISVGPNPANLYPSFTTLTFLQIAKVGVYRTDLDKDIFLNASKSGEYSITTKTDLKKLGEWYLKTDAS